MTLRVACFLVSLSLVACGGAVPVSPGEVAPARGEARVEVDESGGCEQLLATATPPSVRQLLGEGTVVEHLGRSFGESPAEPGSQLTEWEGTVRGALDVEGALEASLDRDSDHHLDVRRVDFLGFTEHTAEWTVDDLRWRATLTVHDDELPLAIRIRCTVAGTRRLDWSDLERLELLSEVLPPVVAAALRSATFSFVETGPELWRAVVVGPPERGEATRSALGRALADSGWAPELGLTHWSFELRNDRLDISRMDVEDAEVRAAPGTWGIGIARR